MDCKHLNCNEIDTRENGIIIDTNFQCSVCGSILNTEKYQDILHDNCSECDGSGVIYVQGDRYTCGCVL